MVDQTLEVLDQYELEIKAVRKGRGSWIVNAREGDFVLKEYKGSEEKTQLQKVLTDRIREQTSVLVQEIVPNKDGNLCSKDIEERNYTLQTYLEGRECNVKEKKECEIAIETMACMHKAMCIPLQKEMAEVMPYSLKKEFLRRNTELRRIRRYLKEKRQKNEFERFLHKSLPIFLEKALEVEQEWEHYEHYCQEIKDGIWFCHGDYQHHNVWLDYNEVMVLQFEKYLPDLPCRDLYLFLRKLLEKNDWDNTIASEMLAIYEKERPLPYMERISMIYRFAYPEKFWKIANYYFNAKKSFVPEKCMEKLERVLEQETAKELFIQNILRELV